MENDIFGAASVDFVCTHSSAAWWWKSSLAQVVHVRRADQRLAGLGREALHRLVDLVLLGQPVLLDLEVDVLRAEDLDQLVQVRARLVELAVHDPLARAAGQAARERDDALGVHREQLQVHARLAAVQAFEEALGGERREVLEALVGRRQQRQVVALDLAVAHVAVVDEVRLEAQQRLDAVLLGGLVELDGAVHDAVVGQADGRLVEGRGALGELADVAGAVEQRVLGVDVQVRDGRGAHRGGNHRRRGGRHPCAARRRARNRAGFRMPRMALYASLGVRRVINACGIYTDLGGSVLGAGGVGGRRGGERDLGGDGRAAGGVGRADRRAVRERGRAGGAGGVGGDRAGGRRPASRAATGRCRRRCRCWTPSC